MIAKNEGLTVGQLGEINAGLHAEVARLNEQVRALAAENADLKTAASSLVSEYVMNKGTGVEFIACITPSKKTIGTGGVWDMWHTIDSMLNKTPVTDAILREVSARAVEGFAGTFNSVTIEGHSMASAVKRFAASIRAGEVPDA